MDLPSSVNRPRNIFNCVLLYSLRDLCTYNDFACTVLNQGILQNGKEFCNLNIFFGIMKALEGCQDLAPLCGVSIPEVSWVRLLLEGMVGFPSPFGSLRTILRD